MATSPARDREQVRPWVSPAVRLAGLGVLLWGIAAEVSPGLSGRHLIAWLLVASVVPAWVVWSTAARDSLTRRLVAFCWLGAAGGVLAMLAPVALAIVGTATLGAAASLELPTALGIAAIAPVTSAAVGLAAGRPASLIIGSAAASLAGLVIGVGRRERSRQAEQAILIAVERERAELEHARAGVLAERNRLAREVHDVLAHTLGALVIQLEALSATVEASTVEASTVEASTAKPTAPGAGTATTGTGGAGPCPDVRDGLRRIRSLAADGLAEARSAVRALRDDPAPLPDQLRRLCESRGAALWVTGDVRDPGPEATLALYRAAQESLTNAAKHAPGTHPDVRLSYDSGQVRLTVQNGVPHTPPGPLARSGGGYGLDGIRERVRLLGGEVTAGPDDAGGWRVMARIPA
ncbi:MAG: sensor histidine kinase [Streptosporangiaceae bacterium]